MAIDAVLPWHTDAWTQVMNQQRNQRLAHAYLISGLPGSGRYLFARALAATLLCTELASDEANSTACGHCRQCLLFDTGHHPDVLDITPEEGKKSIKIDQIRTISNLVNQTSNQTGAIKVIIIQPAEALGTAAANALLKNLEEPPGRTLFLLISEPGAQMLPTIRSRCQPLPLSPATSEQGLAWLSQQSAAAQDELAAALTLASGAPLRALSLLEAGIPAWRGIVQEQLAELADGLMTPLQLAKYCNTQPPAYAIELMQALTLQQVREALQSQKSRRAKRFLQLGRELVVISRQLSSGANPNTLMALEYVFSTWQTISGDKDVVQQGRELQFTGSAG
ncbi:DNA polymerase III subunit delta' [Pseudohongiella acticola]|jgi:DNA polymerase III subunit delta'|uniref:DNA polymerase III subunit delta' n=1 Tax=Pseudohongiella acticola TaxID=1524254 RepID=UPI0030ED6615